MAAATHICRYSQWSISRTIALFAKMAVECEGSCQPTTPYDFEADAIHKTELPPPGCKKCGPFPPHEFRKSPTQ
jgi:hypothetical protein